MQYIKDTAKLTTLSSPCVIKHDLFTQVKDFSSYAIDQEQFVHLEEIANRLAFDELLLALKQNRIDYRYKK